MIMPSRRVVFAAAVLMAATEFIAQDEKWRRQNDHGNRYEGARSEDVSAAPVVALIGFHGHRAHFQPSDDVTLQVSFYLPLAATSVRLTAQEVDAVELYWMEAKPTQWTQGWNQFRPWPVKDVLRRKGIGSDNLAVLVRLDGARSGGGEIAPAMIQKSGQELDVTEYRAYLMAGKELQSIEYRLESVGDGTLSNGRLGRKPGGTPFTVVLPIGKVKGGPMRLELSCKVRGQPGPSAHVVYTFHHQPRVKTGG